MKGGFSLIESRDRISDRTVTVNRANHVPDHTRNPPFPHLSPSNPLSSWRSARLSSASSKGGSWGAVKRQEQGHTVSGQRAGPSALAGIVQGSVKHRLHEGEGAVIAPPPQGARGDGRSEVAGSTPDIRQVEAIASSRSSKLGLFNFVFVFLSIGILYYKSVKDCEGKELVSTSKGACI